MPCHQSPNPDRRTHTPTHPHTHLPTLRRSPAFITPRAFNTTSSAFTILEVILALVIAVGILVVLLYFYQQATNLRGQLIEETERLSAIRLVMDRLTAELRSTRDSPSFPRSFVGASNSIQFIKTDLPSFSPWSGGVLGRAAVADSDLKLVRYRLDPGDETNVSGLVRSEEPLVRSRQLPESSRSAAPSPTPQPNPWPPISEIRFLQFRYWNGTAWLDTWRSPGPPRGIEVSLSPEPMTNLVSEITTDPAMTEGWPIEIFRRVINLPISSAGQAAGTNSQAAAEETASQEGSPPSQEAP